MAPPLPSDAAPPPGPTDLNNAFVAALEKQFDTDPFQSFLSHANQYLAYHDKLVSAGVPFSNASPPSRNVHDAEAVRAIATSTVESKLGDVEQHPDLTDVSDAAHHNSSDTANDAAAVLDSEMPTAENKSCGAKQPSHSPGIVDVSSAAHPNIICTANGATAVLVGAESIIEKRPSTLEPPLRSPSLPEGSSDARLGTVQARAPSPSTNACKIQKPCQSPTRKNAGHDDTSESLATTTPSVLPQSAAANPDDSELERPVLRTEQCLPTMQRKAAPATNFPPIVITLSEATPSTSSVSSGHNKFASVWNDVVKPPIKPPLIFNSAPISKRPRTAGPTSNLSAGTSRTSTRYMKRVKHPQKDSTIAKNYYYDELIPRYGGREDQFRQWWDAEFKARKQRGLTPEFQKWLSTQPGISEEDAVKDAVKDAMKDAMRDAVKGVKRGVRSME
ncbi:hypothetical protein CYLTODRAFT_456410 [Cylindrobasidium torrendii FP15055 ss-10]|uniref:Uncharacterized protein n=1 Tax=Cylindrobasidium torrendii FP15055 ss-10 TaxID=1314674 RepID=A0A0D7B450_9AGAR|nr:hypothetical protein CYLTODRAFT_456410 [Cylindrobasidium torrendii FP15055 ss-10]